MKWRDLAENQIQKARSQGQFDHLEGAGKPLPQRAAGDVISAGMAMMADAGVLPREIELKKAVDAKQEELAAATDPDAKKALMRELGELQMRLAIEQEARRKFYATS